KARWLDQRAIRELSDGCDVAAAAVQQHGVAQGADVPVVKVRRGQCDVEQRRDLERPFHAESFRDGGPVECGWQSTWKKAPRQRERPERLLPPPPAILAAGA